MNTHQEVQDFLTSINNHLSCVSINNFSCDMSNEGSYELKDKFYIVIRVDDITEKKLKKFEAKLINEVKRETKGWGEYLYHVLVNKDELVRMLGDLGPLKYFGYYVCHYFTVNYDTFVKTRKYISEQLNVNAKVINARSYIDESSFYVIIHTRTTGQLDIHKELLGDYCEIIEYNHSNLPSCVIRAKNVNESFMSKFNLISESLGSIIHGLLIGTDYYKKFED